MRYVDLRRRRYETRSQEPVGPLEAGPYLLLALGLALGFVLGMIVSRADSLAGGLLFLIALGALAAYQVWRLTKRRSRGPKTGGEKQLLMAILDAGGNITPVEAALRTSLTVDEAEQALTRFADRGHLLVHGRDGVLHYAMPGR